MFNRSRKKNEEENNRSLWKESASYAHIVDGKSVGAGKNFTSAQKKRIYEANMEHNNGLLRSDLDGKVLSMPKKSKTGVKPLQKEAQVDHITAKSKGGANSASSNAQVLSRKQNRAKSDK